MINNSLKNKGFSLIELLIVVLILGLLVAVALPRYEMAVEKSRASEAYTLLKSIKQAEDIYFLNHPNAETVILEELDINVPGEPVEGKPSVRKNEFFETGFHWENNNSPHAKRVDTAGVTLYYIAYYNPGGFHCVPSIDKYAKLCKSLGGKQDNTCWGQCADDPSYCENRCFKLD